MTSREETSCGSESVIYYQVNYLQIVQGKVSAKTELNSTLTAVSFDVFLNEGSKYLMMHYF